MVEGSLEKKPPFEKPSIEQVNIFEDLFYMNLRLKGPSQFWGAGAHTWNLVNSQRTLLSYILA